MTRPSVLVLSQCLPYPPHSGVTNRTYNVLRQLQEGFRVTLVPFSRRNHQPDQEAMDRAGEALRRVLESVEPPVRIPAERSRLARLMVHARSVFAGRPYTFYEYWDPAVAEQLQQLIAKEQPALVHFDSLDLYSYLPAVAGTPVACTHHSIESDLLRLRADKIRPRYLAPYLHRQAEMLEVVERQVCAGLGLNVMMSEVDAERLRLLAPGARTTVVPNGVDTDFFRPPAVGSEVDGRVTFLGPTYMFPNRDAMEFFLGEVWPIVRAARPDATLEMIGKVSEPDRAKFQASPGVTCLGYVPDVRPPMGQGSCSVVPIRVGGGTRLKILDAWAMGRAVVSTSVGCEGLATVDGGNILVRDDPRAFADAVLEVLSDANLRARLGAAGRETAERYYAWEVIGRNLREAYHRAIGGS